MIDSQAEFDYDSTSVADCSRDVPCYINASHHADQYSENQENREENADWGRIKSVLPEKKDPKDIVHRLLNEIESSFEVSKQQEALDSCSRRYMRRKHLKMKEQPDQYYKANYHQDHKKYSRNLHDDSSGSGSENIASCSECLQDDQDWLQSSNNILIPNLPRIRPRARVCECESPKHFVFENFHTSSSQQRMYQCNEDHHTSQDPCPQCGTMHTPNVSQSSFTYDYEDERELESSEDSGSEITISRN